MRTFMTTDDLFNAVMQLDLEPIKTKLMHEASGEGWSLEKANAVEKEYRRFLCLMKMYPDEDTAPLVDVDTFWHYHILDTMKYAKDCEQAFGYFLHHYPYVGMRGEDDEQFRLDSGNRMRDLYEATFGDAYPGSEVVAERAGFDGIEGIRIPGAAVRAVAYCAGPRAETAYCAGPRAETAYCAGPRVKAQAARDEAATAYCAGPRALTAYCAGPRVKAQAARGEGAVAATAYCAGPRAETAYCAGPRAETAYCAGPRVKAQAGPSIGARDIASASLPA
jgi:hypothetical protein